MKFLFFLPLFFYLNKSLSQDTTNTRIYPCKCDSSIKKSVLQLRMKEKGISCNIKENGIESFNYILIDKSNTPSSLVEAYKNIKLRMKLSVTCSSFGLKIQMAFQESRPASSSWLNSLTEDGQQFAKEVYESWQPLLYNKLCN